MLKIRLQKVGKKNAPSYRVVLAEHTSPPQGRFIEILGSYNPRLKQKSFKKERIEHWLAKGAQLTPSIHNLLVKEKIIEAEKLRAWKPKKKKKEALEKVAKLEQGIKPEEEAKKPSEEPLEVSKEESKTEDKVEEKIEEAPVEEKKQEPEKQEESKTEEKPEESKQEPEKEDKLEEIEPVKEKESIEEAKEESSEKEEVSEEKPVEEPEFETLDKDPKID